MLTTTAETKHAYTRAFVDERTKVYPAIDAFESRCGYRVNLERLEEAAEILACPLKAHAPNWQHGRVVFARARAYLARYYGGPVTLLDIGTAKGFSALCLFWALEDANVSGAVHSVDVLDPLARVRRNTVAEVDGYLTLAETLAPWPETAAITFRQSTGVNWLMAHPERVQVAFIDGKHDGSVVLTEGKLLADRQLPGDVVIFDDIQIPGVAAAVRNLDPYECEYVAALPDRVYAIGVRH